MGKHKKRGKGKGKGGRGKAVGGGDERLACAAPSENSAAAAGEGKVGGEQQQEKAEEKIKQAMPIFEDLEVYCDKIQGQWYSKDGWKGLLDQLFPENSKEDRSGDEREAEEKVAIKKAMAVGAERDVAEESAEKTKAHEKLVEECIRTTINSLGDLDRLLSMVSESYVAVSDLLSKGAPAIRLDPAKMEKCLNNCNHLLLFAADSNWRFPFDSSQWESEVLRGLKGRGYYPICPSIPDVFSVYKELKDFHKIVQDGCEEIESLVSSTVKYCAAKLGQDSYFKVQIIAAFASIYLLPVKQIIAGLGVEGFGLSPEGVVNAILGDSQLGRLQAKKKEGRELSEDDCKELLQYAQEQKLIDTREQIIKSFILNCKLPIKAMAAILESFKLPAEEVVDVMIDTLEFETLEDVKQMCSYTRGKETAGGKKVCMYLLDLVKSLAEDADRGSFFRRFSYFDFCLDFMNYELLSEDGNCTEMEDRFSQEKILIRLLNKSQITPLQKKDLLLSYFDKNSEFLRMSRETLNCYRQLIAGSSDAQAHDEEEYEGKSDESVLIAGAAESETSQRGKVGGEGCCELEQSGLRARMEADVQRLLVLACNLCELDWEALKPDVASILGRLQQNFREQTKVYREWLAEMKRSCMSEREQDSRLDLATLCYAEAFILDLLADFALVDGTREGWSLDALCEAVLVSNGLMYIPSIRYKFHVQGKNQDELILRLIKHIQGMPEEVVLFQSVYVDLEYLVSKMIGIMAKPEAECSPESLVEKKVFKKIRNELEVWEQFGRPFSEKQFFWNKVVVLKQCWGRIQDAGGAQSDVGDFRKILEVFVGSHSQNDYLLRLWLSSVEKNSFLLKLLRHRLCCCSISCSRRVIRNVKKLWGNAIRVELKIF